METSTQGFGGDNNNNFIGTDFPEDNIENLGDQIGQLSLGQSAQLCKYLEDNYGIKCSLTAGLVSPKKIRPAAVFLNGYCPDKKIAVIKMIREITGLDLKQAKELVESTESINRILVKKGLSPDAAVEMKNKFAAIGADCSIREGVF